MDKGAMGQPQMKNEFQSDLSYIIRSLQEDIFCPNDVLERLKTYEGKENITMKDIPDDLKYIISLVLDRDDALRTNIILTNSEQEMQEKLVTAQQLKEQAQASLNECVEMGLKLSEICDSLSENVSSLSAAHFTSGSEKTSKLSKDDDEQEDPNDDCKADNTKSKTREKLGDYFRHKSIEMAAAAEDTEKESHKGKKDKKTDADATGADILEHFGEEELYEETCDGYEDLSELVVNIQAKTSKASDGEKITWVRSKSGHFTTVIADVKDQQVYHDINGDVVPSGYCPKNMEIHGLQLKLVGYDAFSEIDLVPATATVMVYLYPKYKVSFKDMEAEDRSSAIVKLQELMGPDIYVDGSKTAFCIVRRKQDSFLQEGSEEADEDGDDQIPTELMEEETDVSSEEKADEDGDDLSPTELMEEETDVSNGEEADEDGDDTVPSEIIEEDTDKGSEEEGLEESNENEEDLTSSTSPECEPDNSTGNSAQKTRRKKPKKVSRRMKNKQRNESQQAKSARAKEECDQEDSRKKEEKAQQKRERERARHEQKKREKEEKKKAENPNYKRSEKRNKQRQETFVHPAKHKKKTPLISGKSYWSPSLVAYILFLSLSMMLPVYRIYSASPVLLVGLNIPLSTIESMAILVFNRKLKHLLPYFYKVLKSQSYIQADETVIEVFQEKLRDNVTKSYIWIYATIATCPTQIRIYDYRPGRKGEFCKAALASFVGVLITDAYQGYNMVDGVQHAFCFIHARRKIYDAAQNGATSYVRQLAKKILEGVDELFKIESEIQSAGYDPETIAKERQKQMLGILGTIKDNLKKIMQDSRVPSNSKLKKAAAYMLNHYEELTYFLKDGNVPMHNQVSEHAARRVALYRNNSMFCGSPKGAEAFAGILSIAETARANNLDVYKYFLFLLENMREDDFWKDEELMNSLMPWSEKAKKECASSRPVKKQKIRLIGGNIVV